jgi:hypothetical protein
VRFRAATDYLGIDWLWFTARCAERALEAVLVSRSRHLSTTGPKRACDFITQLTYPR